MVIHGYGISLDFGMRGGSEKVTPEAIERLERLINMAPKFAHDHTLATLNAMKDAFIEDEVSLSSAACDLMFALFGDDAGMTGLSYILALVIAECENINLIAALDESCAEHLLFPKRYPWELNEREKLLTEDELIAILGKYIRVLTDCPVDINYINQKGIDVE